MTKEEFTQYVKERKGEHWLEEEDLIVVRCIDCDYENCKGWHIDAPENVNE